MAVVPTATGPETRAVRRRAQAGLTCLLLATALVAPAAPGFAGAPVAAAPTEGQPADAAPLEHLASTIGGLKASLGAIRQDLAAMHDATAASGFGGAAADQLCAVPEAQAETLIALARTLEEQRADAAAERTARQHAEAAMTGELTALRERLAAADAAVIELRRDRELLVKHITALDELVQSARTDEVVDALVEAKPVAIEPAAAQAHALPAMGLMRITQSALAAEALPALGTGGGAHLARAGSRLDLQAELALAQLRIVELTTALDSVRLREEAMDAELGSLRALTESQIKRFLSQR